MKTFHCRFFVDPIGAVEEAARGRFFSSLIALLLVTYCLITVSTAQTTTSTIEGTVTDANGAVISGATVTARGDTLATERNATTNAEGFYRLTALPAGTYVVTISQGGFATSTSDIELTLNRTAPLDIQLQVGTVGGDQVEVTNELPLLEPNASSTGATITPKEIQDLPVNGRDYLDLLQLVPGVAINRQAAGTDNANPVLGERSGNNNFFIDGQPNKDTVNGGPAAQFNQETIAEFQVLTTGYKAEFGQASGAIVNVITKSGGNAFHGVASLFHRNEFLDSVNSLDETRTDAPKLRRFDYSIAGGGPIWKDRIFFFGSSERITEDRQIDFNYPDLGTTAGAATVLQLLRNQEEPLDAPTRSREIRNFFKLNEQFGRHQLVQEVNYTNAYERGAGAGGLPSTRSNSRVRRLLLGFGDTVLLGDQGNPFILTLRAAYRDEPSASDPSQPQFGANTRANFYSFSAPSTPTNPFPLFGDLPQVFFGNALTAANLNQKYTSFSANGNKLFGDHDVKFGWQFLKTKVDGLDPQVLANQLFTSVDDFIRFGPINSGYFLIAEVGGLTSEGNEIHLRNNYNGLYAQDDWKLLSNLTINLGIRWDHDSEFEAKKNFSPRLGVAWAVTPKTVIRAHFGTFYDQFRLGLVSSIPEFGGSDQRLVQTQFYPRGLYGSPTFVSSIAFLSGLPGGCYANGSTGNQTDAQVAATGATCPLFGTPLIGVDRLNRVVAPGRDPIPANTVININNVQALTGLTPQQYADQASLAIGQPAGYFSFGRFGVLSNPLIPPQAQAVAVDSTFQTPHTLAFSIGVQREITKDMVVEANYHHREMRNLLGIRSSIAFRSRVAGIGRSFDDPGFQVSTFGPFFEGKYDGLVLSFNKRLSNRYLLGANYTYAKATDNSLGIFGFPTDSFIGTVPEVTEPCPTANPGCTRQTNANGSFTSRNGRFIPQAGTFYNGPDLDKGPSTLALDHIFQINGLVELPWKFQMSGIFRAQSGFHFSRSDAGLGDPDGDGSFNGVDVAAGRNAFTSPAFINLDMRFSKRFDIGDRVRVDLFLEFFNLLNRQNPASIENREGVTNQPFNSITQVLPGREGQVGFRISF